MWASDIQIYKLNYLNQLVLLLSTSHSVVFLSWEFSIFKASEFSSCLKGKTDVCDGVSEGGDCAVILTDFHFCCQVSNAFFFPSVTQRRQTPQMWWDRERLFYQGGHPMVQLFPNKSIHLLLTARIPRWRRWVVLPRRQLRVHYTCDSQLAVWQTSLTILFVFIFLPEAW